MVVLALVFGNLSTSPEKLLFIVVYGDQAVLAIKSKDLCGDRLPRTIGPLWASVSPCVCSAVEFSTRFTCGDVVLHFCRHAWPADTFACTSQTSLYYEVGQVNLNSASYLRESFLHGITAESPLKTSLSCMVSSSRMLK